jgi:[ribosomal protein S5]-alanine N-acetyltransferase
MLQVNFNPFPILTTDRLVLRPFNDGDVKELFFLRSHEGVMKYIAKPKPKDHNDIFQLIAKMSKMIADNEGVAWAITLKTDPKAIGHISFQHLYKEHYRAEVGYMLHPDHYMQGIMNEALTAVLTYGFSKMGLHSVEANISPENIASQKLLERHNFVREAWFKENYFFEGEFMDSVIYSLINPTHRSPL